MFMLKEKTLEYLKRESIKHGVKKLILFGSCLHKPEDDAGDIDLAAEMYEGADIYRFHGELLTTLSVKMRKNVDMVDLSSDVPIVPHILDEGIVIYECPK